MNSYASGTSVSVEKTKGEIEGLVTRAGADAFASAFANGQAQLQFKLKERIIRFRLPLPKRDDPRFMKRKKYNYMVNNTDEQAYRLWEQACREKWRALFLSIKAKLYSIESGIESFDSAFMAQVVMPNGKTMEELAVPMIEQAYERGAMPDMNVLALTY
jgi:hypothetical protein